MLILGSSGEILVFFVRWSTGHCGGTLGWFEIFFGLILAVSIVFLPCCSTLQVSAVPYAAPATYAAPMTYAAGAPVAEMTELSEGCFLGGLKHKSSEFKRVWYVPKALGGGRYSRNGSQGRIPMGPGGFWHDSGLILWWFWDPGIYLVWFWDDSGLLFSSSSRNTPYENMVVAENPCFYDVFFGMAEWVGYL